MLGERNRMRQVFDGNEMREMDRWAIEEKRIPGLTLMERAAEAAVERIMFYKPMNVGVVCGTGNNGGDGFAIARLLKERSVRTEVFVIGKRERLQGDAAVNYARLEELGIPTVWRVPEGTEEYDCVVDALFGTGLSRAVEGEAAKAIEWMNGSRGVKVAVDIPSGIHAGTGRILGCAVRADETVTFSRGKAGLYLYPGRSCAGKVYQAPIGIGSPNPIEESCEKYILDAEDVRRWLPPRRPDSHKGTYGKILIAAGSPGMMGAAVFAARSAYHMGAGLVRVMIPESQSAVMSISVPEVVQLLYSDPEQVRVPKDTTAVLVGPGLGANEALWNRIMDETPSDIPLIVDADGLNLLAAHPEKRHPRMILTPHMGEASRLSGKTTAELYADLIASARELAVRYQAVVVLKNASTVTADPQGRVCINTNGNPGMSTAGSGDVLAGAIAGLCGQNRDADLWKMAAAGVWLHGRAGDVAVRSTGQYALMASDIVNFLRPDRIILE